MRRKNPVQRVSGGLLLISFLSLIVLSVGAKAIPVVDESQFPPAYLPSGKQMFQQYCAACHGTDGTGHGPAAYSLKTPPADLTTLAKRHGGKFPISYVSDLLLSGKGVAAHGTKDMPTWGPLFRYLDRQSEAAARQRVKNLSDYLETLQKE